MHPVDNVVGFSLMRSVGRATEQQKKRSVESVSAALAGKVGLAELARRYEAMGEPAAPQEDGRADSNAKTRKSCDGNDLALAHATRRIT